MKRLQLMEATPPNRTGAAQDINSGLVQMFNNYQAVAERERARETKDKLNAINMQKAMYQQRDAENDYLAGLKLEEETRLLENGNRQRLTDLSPRVSAYLQDPDSDKNEGLGLARELSVGLNSKKYGKVFGEMMEQVKGKEQTQEHLDYIKNDGLFKEAQSNGTDWDSVDEEVQKWHKPKTLRIRPASPYEAGAEVDGVAKYGMDPGTEKVLGDLNASAKSKVRLKTNALFNSENVEKDINAFLADPLVSHAMDADEDVRERVESAIDEVRTNQMEQMGEGGGSIDPPKLQHMGGNLYVSVIGKNIHYFTKLKDGSYKNMRTPDADIEFPDVGGSKPSSGGSSSNASAGDDYIINFANQNLIK